MFYIFLISSLFIIAIFQVSFLGSFQFLAIVPNFILITLIYLTLYRKFNEVIILAFFLGLFIDIISPELFGVHILFFLGMIVLINAFKRISVFHLNLFSVLILIFIFVLLYNLVFLGIFTYYSDVYGSREWVMILKIFSSNIVSNLVISSLFFPIFGRFFSWLKTKEGKSKIFS